MHIDTASLCHYVVLISQRGKHCQYFIQIWYERKQGEGPGLLDRNPSEVYGQSPSGVGFERRDLFRS